MVENSGVEKSVLKLWVGLPCPLTKFGYYGCFDNCHPYFSYSLFVFSSQTNKSFASLILKSQSTNSLLIYTLISGNLGLEKSRSSSNPRKISVSANLEFFPGLQPEKNWVYTINTGVKPNKKSRFAEPKNFLGFEIDLDFSRP